MRRPPAIPPGAARPRPGFSLIELVTAMCIVGITLAIFIPRLRQSPRTLVDTAAVQLAQDLDVARTRALATRSVVGFAFTADRRSYAGYLDHDRDGVVAWTAAERAALRGSGVRELPAGVRYGNGRDYPPVDPGCAPQCPNTLLTWFTVEGFSGTYEDAIGVRPNGRSAFIYLQGVDNPTAVAAVELAVSGMLRVWRYRAATGWE